jgi:hypothetical protein
MNHSDRGIHIKPELDIKPMVNYQGVKSISMACPGYAGGLIISVISTLFGQASILMNYGWKMISGTIRTHPSN